MSVHVIIDSTVKDKERYGQYLEGVSPMVARFGGCYHVRGGNIRPLGVWKPERIIVIEFPSESHVQAWLTSPVTRIQSSSALAGSRRRHPGHLCGGILR